MSADPGLMVEAAHRIAGDHGPALQDARSLNARVQHIRRALAASFTAALARVVASVSDRAAGRNGSGQVGAGGGAFGNARFNSELQGIVGDSLSFAAVPEPSGRALGAVGSAAPGSDGALAIGPAFSEEAIKRTLDNCRLDYVYEPDWPRLLGARVANAGAGQGRRLVPGTDGLRPETTWHAKHSRRPVESLRAAECQRVPARHAAGRPLAAGRGAVDGRCLPGVRVCLRSARAMWRCGRSGGRSWHPRSTGGTRHVFMRRQSHFEPRFQDLLERHYAATGTPGLIEISLAGAGEPIACTPRDGVRTMYSSAIDALVIGRFLLMKDYWLLRSQEQ